MASYHRILDVFDRRIADNDLQCDCDIHPWDIIINGERWSGRIRLIGFWDVFFLICYNGTSRFEKGLIIYKNEADLKALIPGASESNNNPQSRKIEKDSIYYKIQGSGHPIALKTVYTIPSVQKYTIEIRKPRDPIKKRRVKRAVRFHDSLDLLESAAKVGFIAGREASGHALGHVVGGGFLEAGTRKFVDGMMSSQRSSNVLLSADQ